MKLSGIVLSALAIAVAAPVSAQSTIGVKQMVNPVIIPQTTVHVTLTVKREHIAKDRKSVV